MALELELEETESNELPDFKTWLKYRHEHPDDVADREKKIAEAVMNNH